MVNFFTQMQIKLRIWKKIVEIYLVFNAKLCTLYSNSQRGHDVQSSTGSYLQISI